MTRNRNVGYARLSRVKDMDISIQAQLGEAHAYYHFRDQTSCTCAICFPSKSRYNGQSILSDPQGNRMAARVVKALYVLRQSCGLGELTSG